MEDLSIKVRKLREVYGYSQEFVAYQMGISQAAYCKKESGKTRFTFECAQKISQLYRITFLELMNNSVQDLVIIAIQNTQKKAA